ncbi:cobalamin biosynthesis protein CbiG [Salmonella enterica subsp. arizonae]|uniref:Cobalamin biosynthesis protein CbiG n=1 Tax=Salmonella enterica subsp. arizonae TaxID=59203 RepID=A0A379TA06_SALER|nr:cobalamin biosynthesis protein CbiG [Salmonella enterica subsp. arizonae]
MNVVNMSLACFPVMRAGANALTRYLAGMLGADPVITTATDVNEMSALDTLAFQLNARMTDLRTAVKTVNQMLVSHQRVGLWWDAELTEEIGQCDIRGFIPVDDLQRLPELDALICVSLRNDLPELSVLHWKLVPPARGGGNWLSPRYAISPVSDITGAPA